MRLRLACLIVLALGCKESATAQTDASAPRDAVPDGARDGATPTPDVPAPEDVPPYDPGAAPPCTVAAFNRHVVDQSPGVEAMEAGGLTAVEGGFLVAARQGTSRVAAVDAAPARRDTIDLLKVSPEGFAAGPLTTLYESAPMGTDLSPPTLVPTGLGAVCLFRESLGLPSEGRYATRVRLAVVNPLGARQGDFATVEDRGEPFGAPLPDGSAFVIAPRIVSRNDAGFVVATPNSFRVRTNGTVVDPRGADLTAMIPIDAESVLMRSTSTGAALLFRLGVDLQIVRFDGNGLLDTRPYFTRNLDATRLDDAAVLPEGIILGWDQPSDQMHAIHVAVTSPEGRLRAHSLVDRFEAPGTPVVNVTPVYGGAALTWVRGVGDAAVLRGVVVQPDGRLRGAVTDLLPVPGADGRMLTVGAGRALTFVARDRGAMGTGLTFGRLCMPL